jgi:hypothetical protein
MVGPEIAIPFGAFATAIIFGLGVPLVRAYSRKMDAQSKFPQVPLEVAQRLERMEQALEAVAIEVERISEGQRFTTKLLSDKSASELRQGALSASPARDRAT